MADGQAGLPTRGRSSIKSHECGQRTRWETQSRWMLARLSFPIHDVSGGDASSMVWAFYVQVAVPMRLPDARRLVATNVTETSPNSPNPLLTDRHLLGHVRI